MERTCRDCGKKFRHKNYKGGYIDQCDACSRLTGDAEQKYLGRPGAVSKSANIEIFRNNLALARTVINRERACGFTANLGLSSPKNPKLMNSVNDD